MCNLAIDDVSVVACNASYVFPEIVTPPARYPGTLHFTYRFVRCCPRLPMCDCVLVLDGCKEPIFLRNSTGQIASDEDYPNGQYEQEAKCRWIIDAEDSKKVRMPVLMTNLQLCNTYLEPKLQVLKLEYDVSFWLESAERCEYDFVRGTGTG